MSEYYGVTPSSDFFAHYGVKGMKWGVRRAVEKGNTKRLDRHYKKATKKLEKLKTKADVLYNLDQRKYAPSVIGASLVPAAAGIAVPILAKSEFRSDAERKILGGLNTAIGLTGLGIGLHDAITGSRRTKKKGHDKAVKKVKEWQKEMKSAFKGTKYQKNEDNRPDFKDVYTLYEHGILGKDSKGKPIGYRAPTISVEGSDLVRDSNSKAKSIFKQRLSDPPVTQSISDSKVIPIVHTPSGRGFMAGSVDNYIKVKKPKRKNKNNRR